MHPQYIKITAAPVEHEGMLAHADSFQILDWQNRCPVIAFQGKRITLSVYSGWSYESVMSHM